MRERQPAPPVFVIVLNWNGWEDTIECLASLEKLEYPNYEVVVVDNGSTDGSGARIWDAYPGVTLLETGKNLGFAGGNNMGLRYALGRGAEYVWLLNNDTVVEPASLGMLVELMQEDSRIGFISPEIYYYDAPEEPTGTGGGITLLNPKFAPLDAVTAGVRWYECEHVIGVAILVRGETVREVGEMDEGYFMYREETDWLLKASSVGWKIAVAGRARIWHKIARSAVYGSAFQEYHMTRNTLEIVRRFYPTRYPWFLLSYLPYRVAAAVLKHRRSRLTTIKACLRGIRDHLRNVFAGGGGP